MGLRGKLFKKTFFTSIDKQVLRLISIIWNGVNARGALMWEETWVSGDTPCMKAGDQRVQAGDHHSTLLQATVDQWDRGGDKQVQYPLRYLDTPCYLWGKISGFFLFLIIVFGLTNLIKNKRKIRLLICWHLSSWKHFRYSYLYKLHLKPNSKAYI